MLAGQNSLRIRPQLWHALGHLRDVAPDEYQQELSRLWASELRPHLRMLIIEFLGRQTTPMSSEVRLALHSFDDPWFQRRFLNAVVGSPGWFAQLAASYLPMLMTRPIHEAAIVQPILGQAMGFAPQEALALVDVHWLPYPIRDEQSWQVLVMGILPPQDNAWVVRIETMLSRTDFNSWAVGYAAGIVSAVLPSEAPRLVAAWLKQQWQKVQAGVQPRFLLLSKRKCWINILLRATAGLNRCSIVATCTIFLPLPKQRHEHLFRRSGHCIWKCWKR